MHIPLSSLIHWVQSEEESNEKQLQVESEIGRETFSFSNFYFSSYFFKN